VTVDEILTLTHATERDVDLILVEELKCSIEFVRWLCDRVSQAVGRAIEFDSSEVLHSRRRIHNRREIDIELKLSGTSVPSFILIENKLDTAEQFRQAESYSEEAQVLVNSGQASLALTVLVCPRDYAYANQFASKFNCCVSYEQIISFLEQRISREAGEIAARLKHRRNLLQQALTKARRGYEAVPMPQIEAFNDKYVALMSEARVPLIPGPTMLKEGRPGESKTMIFASETLPKWQFLPQTRIVHQLREGNVNINFYTWGNHFAHLAVLMAPALAGTPYRPMPTINKRARGNSGLMIVVDTPPIDNLLGFDAQRDEILVGIRKAVDLRRWFLGAKDTIEACSRKVAELSS
jgi:hypothetical protein